MTWIASIIVLLFVGTLPAQASATVVQTVDEPVATKAGKWTHHVGEAGDYQIGMAWIEVKSRGRVDLRVLAGGKEIKSLTMSGNCVTLPSPSPGEESVQKSPQSGSTKTTPTRHGFAGGMKTV